MLTNHAEHFIFLAISHILFRFPISLSFFLVLFPTPTGFLQLVGCLGALRLSEKLLNAYWLLLLVLLIGDAVLGIFWMFKFDRIMHELQPMLRFVLTFPFIMLSFIQFYWNYFKHCCNGIILTGNLCKCSTNSDVSPCKIPHIFHFAFIYVYIFFNVFNLHAQIPFIHRVRYIGRF